MQEIKIYVAANSALGVIRDYANAKGQAAPTLVRGCEVLLRLRLFANSDGDTPYPIDQLQSVVSWQWVMDRDYDSATTYILEGENAEITVQSITETIDDVERTFTEVTIPLLKTNTEELAAWIGKEKSKSGLAAELVGFDANGDDVFVLQLENFTFRNRITSLGDPTEIDPEYLTAAQVTALVRGTVTADLKNPLEVQFSVDGTSDWHETQTAEDKYYRQRVANIEAEWGEAIMMLPGTQGGAGYTPVRGTDYWTEEDIATIQAYIDGQLVTVQTELEGI